MPTPDTEAPTTENAQGHNADAVQREWEGWVLIKSAERTESGEYRVSGPVASLKKDFDGHTLTRTGILTGLRSFCRLGGSVDYEHKYHQTKDLDDIIGECVDIFEVDGVPWMTVRLLLDPDTGKLKPHGEKIWRHLRSGGRLGFSIEGWSVRHDPRDKNTIIETFIKRVTIAVAPKGLDGDTRLRAGGRPDGATDVDIPETALLAKAIAEDADAACIGAWCPVHTGGHGGAVIQAGRGSAVIQRAAPLAAAEPPLEKALETGAGIVQPGTTDGSALRGQAMPRRLASPERAPAKDEPCGCGGHGHADGHGSAVIQDDSEGTEQHSCTCTGTPPAKGRKKRKKRRAAEPQDALVKACEAALTERGGVRHPGTVARTIAHELRRRRADR